MLIMIRNKLRIEVDNFLNIDQWIKDHKKELIRKLRIHIKIAIMIPSRNWERITALLGGQFPPAVQIWEQNKGEILLVKKLMKNLINQWI
jgi:hypothetical protein